MMIVSVASVVAMCVGYGDGCGTLLVVAATMLVVAAVLVVVVLVMVRVIVATIVVLYDVR